MRCTLFALVPALLGLCSCAGRATAPPPAMAKASHRLAGEPPVLRLPDTTRPLRYELELTILPESETFSGVMKIPVRISAKAQVLWLHATDLVVKEARLTVAGQRIPVQAVQANQDFLGLVLDREIGPGVQAEIYLGYQGKLDGVRSQGLYRQSEGADPYVYSFFEPTDARRAFPCFDEPSFKVPWRLTLNVRKDHVALANAAVVSEQDLGPGPAPGPSMKRVVFAETPPLPSYLVALIVGPFEVVEAGTAGRHGTALRFAVPRGRAGELGYAKEVTPRILALLEDYVGIPYPFGKLDVAVVPRFWGTMEHPGLVALGQPLTLIKPEEDSLRRRQAYANTAIHELAHYWFGDYVTNAWWDDTWLNEALGSWMDLKITDAFEATWRYDLHRVDLAAAAMAEDSLISAKKIRQTVLSRHDIASSFDNQITYAKGAAVLYMFEHFVGPEKFQAGIRRYLREHRSGNATTDDLLGALAAEAGDQAAALRSFLDQPGVPLISVELDCAPGAAPRVLLSQQRFLPMGSGGPLRSQSDKDLRWDVPVCVRYGGKEAGRACTLLSARFSELTLPAKSCPEWVMANEGAAGYYRVKYADPLRARLLAAGSALTVPERLSLLADSVELARSGGARLSEVLGQMEPLWKDPDLRVVAGTFHVVRLLDPHLVPDELRAGYSRFLRRAYGQRGRALGWRERPADDSDARLVRPWLVSYLASEGQDQVLRAEGRALAARYLEDRRAVPPDLAPAVLRIAALDGDRAYFDRLVGAARGTADHRERLRFLAPLGALRDPPLLRAALELVAGGEFDIRDALPILWVALRQREGREAAYAFLKERFDGLAGRMRADEIQGLFSLGDLFCDEAHRADVAAFFTGRAQKHDGAPQRLLHALEEMDQCIAMKQREQPGISAFLKQQ